MHCSSQDKAHFCIAKRFPTASPRMPKRLFLLRTVPGKSFFSHYWVKVVSFIFNKFYNFLFASRRKVHRMRLLYPSQILILLSTNNTEDGTLRRVSGASQRTGICLSLSTLITFLSATESPKSLIFTSSVLLIKQFLAAISRCITCNKQCAAVSCWGKYSNC